MRRRPITIACWDYDRTAALADGRVQPQGLEVTYLPLLPAETFFRMVRNQEFDVAEMSLSTYVVTLGRDAPFVAMPVFPSRSFRHNGIYVHKGAGITAPGDLVGRVVGVPEYQVTAAVWIRGILAEHHGVPVEAVHYRTGGIHDPRRVEKVEISPPGVDIRPIPAGKVLSDMLAAGEIEALYTPRIPRSFEAPGSPVSRLFEDPRAAEEAYFATTGIFPIMHTVVIRRELYERDPWIAGALFSAFCEAKQLLLERIGETGAPLASLPWAYAETVAVRELMGDDFWAYGLEKNEHVLRTFLRYSHEQGLASRIYDPAELFAPETLDAFAI